VTTLVEFLHPIRKGRQSDMALGALYFLKHFRGTEAATVADVRAGLIQARIPSARSMNLARALNSSGAYAERQAGGYWTITTTGEGHIREVLELPSVAADIQHDTVGLERVATAVKNAEVRGYIEETIKCLSVDALRAAVVFLWTGAARTLQEKALATGVKTLNPALAKHDPKARTVTKVDDFAYIKDKTLLLACGELGVLDKGERGILQESLDLRNKCGHPTRYKPGSAKVSSYIEDVVGIVWGS
jgi:hypothetical protein